MAQGQQAVQQVPTLPEFVPDEEWVVLADKIIDNSGIAGNTNKFLILYASLPTDIQREFSSLLSSAAATTYTDLVANLKDRFKIPNHKKFELLHTIEQIGDRNPRTFLRQLRNKYTAAGGITADSLRYAFAYGLPQQYRTVVLTTDSANIEDAAAKVEDMWYADRSNISQQTPMGNPFALVNTMGVSQQGGLMAPWQMVAGTADLSLVKKQTQASPDFNILQAGTSSDISKTKSINDQLLQELRNTQEQVRRLERELKFSPPNANRGRGRGYPQAAQRGKYIPPHMRNRPMCHHVPTRYNPQGLCRFHLQFGQRAFSCEGACTFQQMQSREHLCTDPCPWSRFLEHGTGKLPGQKN